MQKQVRKTLSALLSVAIVMASTAGYPIEIRLDQNMNLRTPDGDVMTRSGRLLAGSIISIPDNKVIVVNGKIDLVQTLAKWRSDSELKKQKFPGIFRFDGHRRETFFPVTIIKAILPPGAKPLEKNAKLQEFMALEFLNRRGNAFVTTKAADVLTARKAATPNNRTASATPTVPTQANQASDTSHALAPVAPAPLAPLAFVPPPLPPLNMVAEEIVVTAPRRHERPLNGQACATCGIPATDVVPPVATSELRDIGEILHPYTPATAQHFQGFRTPYACDAFINSDGDYGKYGEMIRNDVANNDNFMGAAAEKSLENICPSFHTFSPQEKEYFWTWVFTAIAAQESTCNPDSVGRGVNAPAIGLYQMPSYASQRRWRERIYGACAGNIKDPQTNIDCAVRTTEYFILQHGRSLYDQSISQYFQALARKGVTHNIIAEYRGCRR